MEFMVMGLFLVIAIVIVIVTVGVLALSRRMLGARKKSTGTADPAGPGKEMSPWKTCLVLVLILVMTQGGKGAIERSFRTYYTAVGATQNIFSWQGFIYGICVTIAALLVLDRFYQIVSFRKGMLISVCGLAVTSLISVWSCYGVATGLLLRSTANVLLYPVILIQYVCMTLGGILPIAWLILQRLYRKRFLMLGLCCAAAQASTGLITYILYLIRALLPSAHISMEPLVVIAMNAAAFILIMLFLPETADAAGVGKEAVSAPIPARDKTVWMMCGAMILLCFVQDMIDNFLLRLSVYENASGNALYGGFLPLAAMIIAPVLFGYLSQRFRLRKTLMLNYVFCFVSIFVSVVFARPFSIALNGFAFSFISFMPAAAAFEVAENDSFLKASAWITAAGCLGAMLHWVFTVLFGL